MPPGARTTSKHAASSCARSPVRTRAASPRGRTWATSPATTSRRYAYFRVGYHRGLDQLRQSGWRGSGYVRSSHPENRGFLAALDGLRRTADAIGEADEADRCAEFLFQLDPNPEGSGESRPPG